MKISIGVDVGKTGGICVLEDTTIKETYTIPVLGKVVDTRALSSIFHSLKACYDSNEFVVAVAIEEVHAIFGCGAGSTFEFGRVYGLLEGIICACGFRYMLIAPKIWQREMFLGIPEIRKPSKEVKKKDGTSYIKQGSLETKKMALVAVKRLFPDNELTGDKKKGSTFHDGLVDATLIAEWARRKI